jgi:hypothetical protein
VSLVNSSRAVVATVSADSSASYTFNNVALGTYTLSASGADSSGVHYTSSTLLTVAGNAQNVIINTVPS